MVGLIAGAIRSAITGLSPSLPGMSGADHGANQKTLNETPREDACLSAPDGSARGDRGDRGNGS